MQISLTAELAQFVREKIQAGQYADENEVIQGALETLRDQEQLTTEDLDDLRRQIAPAIASLERGEGASWDSGDLKSRVRKQIDRERQAN
ncbi:MAG: hypothetical protein IH986_06435 [Planctomycetes bacterium]|nr:hypothetical protein [Planctomycetota bacterium]